MRARGIRCSHDRKVLAFLNELQPNRTLCLNTGQKLPRGFVLELFRRAAQRMGAVRSPPGSSHRRLAARLSAGNANCVSAFQRSVFSVQRSAFSVQSPIRRQARERDSFNNVVACCSLFATAKVCAQKSLYRHFVHVVPRRTTTSLVSRTLLRSLVRSPATAQVSKPKTTRTTKISSPVVCK